jgi:hypothetical protein
MYFKILDSIPSIEKKVNLALSEEINKEVNQKFNLLYLTPL